MKGYKHLSRLLLLGSISLAAMPAASPKGFLKDIVPWWYTASRRAASPLGHIANASFAIALIFAQLNFNLDNRVLAQSVPTLDILPEARNGIYQMFKSATVRVVKADSAGSGVIIAHQDNVYTVLTNWHVVDSSNPVILTVDDQQYQLVEAPQQVENADLAVLKFYSEAEYPIAQVQPIMPHVGDQVYAAGFPLIIDEADSLDWGNQAFRLTPGKISVIPSKSMPHGYQLGYTNETEIGMSGSPIFNEEGALIAIHGRGKYRDPSFGVYIFEDGSEPSPEQLEEMIKSSWGIPLSAYAEFLN